MTSSHDAATSPSITRTTEETAELLEARFLDLQAQNDALRRDAQEFSARAETMKARFEAAPTAQLVLDPKGLIREVNAAARVLLGRPVERLLNKALSVFIAGSSLTSYHALLKGAASNMPGAPGVNLQLQPPQGPALPVCLSVSARGEDTKVVEYLVTLMDMKAQHDAVELLTLQRDQVEGQVRDVSARLVSQRDEVEEIVRALSGEVQTAVHRASGFLDLLHREVGVHSDGVEQHFGSARRALSQATSMMAALVGYVRTTRARVRLREVNLGLVLNAVRRDLDPQCVGRQVKWSADALPVVQGDSQTLQVVLTELLSNALKFTSTREEARIRVRVQETAGEVCLGVEDNGVGLNMRFKDEVFRVFRRLHPSGTFEGAGVGLAVVRRVCERFGARVWAEGKPEVGATFWVAWPKQPVVLA
ncbi:sensor histidine kinase [Deinococcus pimensis]|uniref:sensor histidine kinase n=1 Tax=Deinococcus pimensis TaxID=309888 RepID=UPI0004AF3E53|nr:ATP-binding protein [Deinococcus pimensis]